MPLNIPRTEPFPTTDWSEIRRLGDDDFADAIAHLCQQYWYPVYAFIRRRLADSHQAEDLTQAFFTKVIVKNSFRAADPDKGRFRSYLLTSVRNFLATELIAQSAQRRGGDAHFLSLDFVSADQFYQTRQAGQRSPEAEFDRAWASTLLDRAIESLRDEYRAKGQLQRFESLSPTLQSLPLDFESVASVLALDESAARKAASRFRRRFGQLLRAEISKTLSENGDLEDEIAWIMRVFAE